MKTVWKFHLPVTDTAVLTMPAGAKVLFVARELPQIITLWAEVDTEAPTEARLFSVVGTGNPMDGGMPYLGTVFDSPFVWHVFEITS